MLNRFKNLRIKLKLVWGFGVAGLLLLIIGVMSFEGMNRLSGQTEFIYKTNLIPVTMLSDLRAAMLRRSNLVVWHILANDAATMAVREKGILELDKTIEDLTAKYEPVIVTESEKKLFEQLTGGVPAYKNSRTKVLELSKNSSKAAAAELQKTELTEQLAVLYAALDGLIAENEKQAQESYAASHSLSATLNWTMIALIVSALLIGIFTVWFVSKLIVENLTNVLTAAGHLQNGHLTHRSQVATQDEIGQLATAFNQMAETMQGKVEQEQKNASEMKGLTDALDRVQAVIEFTLDGTVLNANDNFLKTMGYTLAEIKGQHHRMFCEAAYANSGEYTTLWAKLNRGEFDAGLYRRIGKGGKEIWIQASYNPILDAMGKVCKVVEFATDVTEHKNRNAEYKGKLIAINKAQAMIEFGLDGTVLNANDNFLQTMGYTLAEIKGQHHRMFCEAAYTSSGEYAAFWAKLNRGEFDAGQYRQIGKGGKEIWIQASYNPILDANGKVYKVVKFATDITEQKNRNAEYKGKLIAINKAQAMIEFALDGTILEANDNFLQTMGYTLAEIKGQHHRMFCEAAYTSSGEYAAFWAKLNRGEFDAGQYRRVGKGGKEIWIQASYNPILDANGKIYKIVKFATDITVEKNRNAEFEGKLIAINKAQAVIEFALDGTILEANDNFLQTMGYTLAEIKGQHHRMFCEVAYTSSGEYAAFWAKLNRGEFDAGQYRQIGKGGKEIWIQASYNPILDANGKIYKVVKFATDITAQKQAQLELETCMAEAQQALNALASGDLTRGMNGTYRGELQKIKASINSALGSLTQTITIVRSAVEAVTNGSEEIAKGNEDLSQRTSEQAGSLEETSASMEEMTSAVRQNADNAKRADQLAVMARETADKGGAVTMKAVEAMGEINKSSKKIADIITVIDEIAFQTNLLALNAAVEAARAGEHGRGFAVVATEVRNLAQRSATAAKEIKGLINESIQRVGDGTELVNQSGKTLDEIVNSVKRVTDIIAEISAASQEQASGIDQVNKAIMQMDETTQQNAALVEETTSAAQSMSEQAKDLMRQVGRFILNESGKTPPGMHEATPARDGSGGGQMQVVRTMPQLSPRPAVRKPAVVKASAGIGAGNGKDRRNGSEEFEDF